MRGALKVGVKCKSRLYSNRNLGRNFYEIHSNSMGVLIHCVCVENLNSEIGIETHKKCFFVFGSDSLAKPRHAHQLGEVRRNLKGE